MYIPSSDDWEERYRSGETHWDRGGLSPALHTWMERGTLRPCRVLIPACGRGHEVVRLCERGFEVTGIDVAPSAIAQLSRALENKDLKANLVCADMLHWEPRHTFDAIYEQTSLCALSPEHWTSYAYRLHRWLRPHGVMFALFMQTHRVGGPPFHCDLEQMRGLFPESQWSWREEETLSVPHPTGLDETGCVLVRRCARGARV